MAQRKNKEDIHYHSNLHPMCVPTPDSVKPNKWPKKCPLWTARHLECKLVQRKIKNFNAKGMVLGTTLATTKNQPLHDESLDKYIPFQHYFWLGVAALPLTLRLWLIIIGVKNKSIHVAVPKWHPNFEPWQFKLAKR